MRANGDEVGVLLLCEFEQAARWVAAHIVTSHPDARWCSERRDHAPQAVGNLLRVRHVGR